MKTSDPKTSHADDQLQNVNVAGTISLVSPRQMTREMPAAPAAQRTVLDGRRLIRNILTGDDKRLLVIVGPCSIHDEAAAMAYAERLNALRQDVASTMMIIMRVYFEKPRTTVGWKGLINDPDLNGSFNIEKGLRIARRLLLHVTGMGLPTATEVLDPIVPQYIDDLVCWAAIGARTTESQTHRQMASGLSMPVGYKNATDGSVQIAIDAMQSARSPHSFLGIDDEGLTCIVQTRGNAWGHVILRGGNDQPNYAPRNVAAATDQLAAAGLPPIVMIDCSHANSGKKHEQQRVVWESVIDQRAAGNEAIVGLMLESNLHEGNQKIPADLSQLKYGVSVTDACINWDETESLIRAAHEKLSD